MILHTVPPPNVTISPSGSIQGAVVGSPQVIGCTITEVSEEVPDSLMIIWIGPNGFMNSSRTIIMDATNSNDNTYSSSVQFTYLMEGDNGTYTCVFMAGEISVSQSVELQSLTSKLSFINCLCVLGEVI